MRDDKNIAFERKMTNKCNEQLEFIKDTTKLLVEYVTHNGGEIDTSNENDENDNIYAYVYDEADEHYKDFKVTKVKVEDSVLMIRIDYFDKEEDNWYCVMGGMVLMTPTLHELCEILPEYVD